VKRFLGAAANPRVSVRLLRAACDLRASIVRDMKSSYFASRCLCLADHRAAKNQTLMAHTSKCVTATTIMSVQVDIERADLVRTALVLEWLTLAWVLIEAGVAIWAGSQAHSLSLIAFGADSVIEALSAGVLLWRLNV
jgi:hypothetical protein